MWLFSVLRWPRVGVDRLPQRPVTAFTGEGGAWPSGGMPPSAILETDGARATAQGAGPTDGPAWCFLLSIAFPPPPPAPPDLPRATRGRSAVKGGDLLSRPTSDGGTPPFTVGGGVLSFLIQPPSSDGPPSDAGQTQGGTRMTWPFRGADDLASWGPSHGGAAAKRRPGAAPSHSPCAWDWESRQNVFCSPPKIIRPVTPTKFKSSQVHDQKDGLGQRTSARLLWPSCQPGHTRSTCDCAARTAAPPCPRRRHPPLSAGPS